MHSFRPQISRIVYFFELYRWAITFASLMLVALLVSIYFFQYEKDTALRSSFIQTTWTVIGVLIGALGVYDFIASQNRLIKPEILINRGSGMEVVLNANEYDLTVTVSISNAGNRSIKPDEYLYYSIMVPNSIYQGMNFVKNDAEGNPTGPKLRSETAILGYRTIGGMVVDAVHPGHHIREFDLKLRFSLEGEYEVKYFFNSVEGRFPKGVNIDSLTGFGSIPISVKRQSV